MTIEKICAYLKSGQSFTLIDSLYTLMWGQLTDIENAKFLEWHSDWIATGDIRELLQRPGAKSKRAITCRLRHQNRF